MCSISVQLKVLVLHIRFSIWYFKLSLQHILQAKLSLHPSIAWILYWPWLVVEQTWTFLKQLILPAISLTKTLIPIVRNVLLSHPLSQVAPWTDRMFAWRYTTRKASRWRGSRQIQRGAPCCTDTPTRSSKCLQTMEYATFTLTLGVQREKWWVKTVKTVARIDKHSSNVFASNCHNGELESEHVWYLSLICV